MIKGAGRPVMPDFQPFVSARYITTNMVISPAPAGCALSSTFLQSSFWGDFKTRFGWKAHSFSITLEPEFTSVPPLSLLVLTRKVASITFGYVPWGPQFPDSLTLGTAARARLTAELASCLKPLLPGLVFIRFDLPWPVLNDGPEPPPGYAPLRKAPVTVQAPDTVIIDLIRQEDAILAAMKPKWRYNIRLGEKKTAVTRCGVERLADFYALLEETARRDHIFIHHESYYRTLFELAETGPATPSVSLYLAEYEQKPVAGLIALFYQKEAVYLYGASSSENRNLMAPYALQWRAMRDAKAAGCAFYDLFGIPPTDDPRHPMAGLYRFKTGFGGTIIHRAGCYDYAYKPVLGGLFHAAEHLRKALRKRR